MTQGNAMDAGLPGTTFEVWFPDLFDHDDALFDRLADVVHAVAAEFGREVHFSSTTVPAPSTGDSERDGRLPEGAPAYLPPGQGAAPAAVASYGGQVEPMPDPYRSAASPVTDGEPERRRRADQTRRVNGYRLCLPCGVAECALPASPETPVPGEGVAEQPDLRLCTGCGTAWVSCFDDVEHCCRLCDHPPAPSVPGSTEERSDG